MYVYECANVCICTLYANVCMSACLPSPLRPSFAPGEREKGRHGALAWHPDDSAIRRGLLRVSAGLHRARHAAIEGGEQGTFA